MSSPEVINRDINSPTAALNNEVSLREVFFKITGIVKYVWSKKGIIISVAFLGALIGLGLALKSTPVYQAELTFSLQDEKSGSGLSSALGLASQFGINLSGDAGGEFSGDNLLLLMQSRSMVERALLTTISIKQKPITIANYYIDINHLKKAWDKKPEIRNITYLPNSDRNKFTIKQDSILGTLYRSLVDNNYKVTEEEKSTGIYNLKVVSNDEIFSKVFAEVLIRVVSDYYIQLKTEKSLKNVNILQRQTDSVRHELNGAISGVAQLTDINPNLNPTRQILRAPAQRRQVDIQANTAILNELVKNLEIAKMSLLQQTPLVQIIDKPILPLQKLKLGKLKSLIIGGFVGGFFAIAYVLIRRFIKSVVGH